MFLILAFLFSSSLNDLPRGQIKNDAEPWFIEMHTGERYGCFYEAGSQMFHEDQAVFLEIVDGEGIMIALSDDETARVHCVDLGRKWKKNV